MNAAETMESEEFKKCVAFHGHICPGLCIGYQAAKAAMAWLKENRSEDEETVAIVETDACAVDAVQVLTGCTFGKGNFIHKDYGKMALTLLSRRSGKGVRLAMKPKASGPDETHAALIRKMSEGGLSETEQKQFETLHQQRSRAILETPAEALFTLTETYMPLPNRARIEPSAPCDRCGEPVMKSKLTERNGKTVCRGCLEGLSG